MKQVAILFLILGTNLFAAQCPVQETEKDISCKKNESTYIRLGASIPLDNDSDRTFLATHIGIGVRSHGEHAYDTLYSHTNHPNYSTHESRICYLYQPEEFGGVYVGSGIQYGISLGFAPTLDCMHRKFFHRVNDNFHLFAEIPLILGFKWPIKNKFTFLEATITTDKILSVVSGFSF